MLYYHVPPRLPQHIFCGSNPLSNEQETVKSSGCHNGDRKYPPLPTPTTTIESAHEQNTTRMTVMSLACLTNLRRDCIILNRSQIVETRSSTALSQLTLRVPQFNKHGVRTQASSNRPSFRWTVWNTIAGNCPPSIPDINYSVVKQLQITRTTVITFNCLTAHDYIASSPPSTN